MIKYLFLFSILFIPLAHSMERITLNYGGEARSYLIYIPDVKKDSYDLMIGLHGYSGSATGFEKELTYNENFISEVSHPPLKIKFPPNYRNRKNI